MKTIEKKPKVKKSRKSFQGLINQLNQYMKAHPDFETALDAFDQDDLEEKRREIGNLSKKWSRLIRQRKRAISTYKSMDNIPQNVQKFHTLRLLNLKNDTSSIIQKMNMFLLEFDLSGLNVHMSKFFQDFVLDKNLMPHPNTSNYFLDKNLYEEGKKTMQTSLKELGFTNDDFGLNDEQTDDLPDDIPIDVEEDNPPGHAPSVSVVIGGMGGGGGSASFRIPKGVSNWFVDFFEKTDNFLTDVVDFEFSHGLQDNYGNHFILTNHPKYLNGTKDPVAVAAGVLAGLAILGSALLGLGEALGSSKLKAAGHIVIVIGSLGSLIGLGTGVGSGSFVDP